VVNTWLWSKMVMVVDNVSSGFVGVDDGMWCWVYVDTVVVLYVCC